MSRNLTPPGFRCLVTARHMDVLGVDCHSTEVAHLFLPEQRVWRGLQMSVQLVFHDDDDYIFFDDEMLDTFIKRRRISLGLDGYWEVLPAAPEAWIAATASESTEIWMKPDMLLSLDEFVVAARRWRNQS